MNWITPVLLINLALTLGPVESLDNNGNLFVVDLPAQIVSVETTVGVELFDTVGIEGDAFVYTSPPWIEEGSFFAPIQSDFYFRTYLSRWGVKIGWEHLCTHPTITYGYTYLRRYGGRDTFFLSYELGSK